MINGQIHTQLFRMMNAFDKQIAEFNFKLLYDQSNCNFNLNKWNKVAKHYWMCEQVQYIEYLIFGCTDTKSLWV
jgi:hypothetical protein